MSLAGPGRPSWITGPATWTIVASSRFIASAVSSTASAAQRYRWRVVVDKRRPLSVGTDLDPCPVADSTSRGPLADFFHAVRFDERYDHPGRRRSRGDPRAAPRRPGAVHEDRGRPRRLDADGGAALSPATRRSRASRRRLARPATRRAGR